MANQCWLCGTDFRPAFRIQQNGSWSYSRCANCGILSLVPMPDDETLRGYYNQAYAVQHEAYSRRVAEHAPPMLDELGKRFPRRGKLLEVGCSYGHFLDAARQKGWTVSGIEIDDRAALYGQDKLSLSILVGTLESQIQKLQPPYDVITAFHVIEHLRDPAQFLRSCRSLLREGGTLVLKTPNIESWIAKRTGAFWEWLSPPAHIHLFSGGSLQRALHKNGFEVERIWSRRGDAHNHLFQLVRAFGAYVSSRRQVAKTRNENTAMTQRAATSGQWRITVLQNVSEIVYYPFTLAVDPWLGKKGQQPELVAIATAAALL